MDRHGWKPFLERWSGEWRIANPPDDPGEPSQLGFPPASEAEVTALEARRRGRGARPLAEHERHPHSHRTTTLDALSRQGADPVQELIAQAGRTPLSYGVPEFDAAVRDIDDHVAPVSLLADPRIAPLITPERGREILTSCRGTGR